MSSISVESKIPVNNMCNVKQYFTLFIYLVCVTFAFGCTNLNSTRSGYTKAKICFLQDALLAYKNDMGRFPSTDEGLVILVKASNDTDNLRGHYLDRYDVPRDAWQNYFIYYYPSIHGLGVFDLYSKGPDGVDDFGKGDDIASCSRSLFWVIFR